MRIDPIFKSNYLKKRAELKKQTPKLTRAELAYELTQWTHSQLPENPNRPMYFSLMSDYVTAMRDDSENIPILLDFLFEIPEDRNFLICLTFIYYLNKKFFFDQLLSNFTDPAYKDMYMFILNMHINDNQNDAYAILHEFNRIKYPNFPELPPPIVIDHNLFEKQFGHGGYAKVYKTKGSDGRRYDAVKVYKLPDVCEFFAEVRVLNRLQGHPYVIGYHGYAIGTAPHVYLMISLEYANPLNLHHMCDKIRQKGASLAVENQILCLLQIMTGLEFIHKKGIMHRDLKPSNICIQVNPQGKLIVKIIDFNSSVDEEMLQDELKEYGRTVHCTFLSAAPEVLLTYDLLDGQNEKTLMKKCEKKFRELLKLSKEDRTPFYSFASDIYSVGIIAYFLWAQDYVFRELGDIRFRSGSEAQLAMISEILMHAESNDKHAICEFSPDHDRYKATVSPCLTFDWRQRPTGQKLLEGLQNCVNEFPEEMTRKLDFDLPFKPQSYSN